MNKSKKDPKKSIMTMTTRIGRTFRHEVELLNSEVIISFDAENGHWNYKVNGVSFPLKFRSLRGAQRETTGNMINWGYRPIDNWHELVD